MQSVKPESWVRVCPQGLYVEPGDFFIDPVRGVDRAVITHGHADHARPGNRHVLATPETLAIMDARYGDGAAESRQALPYDAPIDIGGVRLWLAPAGHVLGSAQAVLEWRGCRILVSGDYKSSHATCLSPRLRSACPSSVIRPTRRRSPRCSAPWRSSLTAPI